MAANYNKVILAGNLTRDPEIRYLSDGTSVATFPIAVSRRSKQRSAVDYVDLVAWSKIAEICNAYLHKGSSVLVEGELRFRGYEKNGERRSKVEVVIRTVQFLSSVAKGEGERTAAAGEGDYEDAA